MLRGNTVLQGENDQERPGQQLDGAQEDPARPRRQQRRPPREAPAQSVFRLRRGQEAEIVRLLSDRGGEGGRGGGGGAEEDEVEPAGILLRTNETGPVAQRRRVAEANIDERGNLQDQPDR